MRRKRERTKEKAGREEGETRFAEENATKMGDVEMGIAIY